MLTLTENASTIVKDITAQQGLADSAGLRITSEDTPEASFAVTAAPQPEPGDQIVEADGASVYLDAPSAEQLADKVLDARVDEEGRVEFAIGVQG